MGLLKFSFRWHGDTKEKLNAAPAILKKVSQEVAEEALDLVKQTFEEGKDPYGQSWKPTMRSQWGGALLQQTGRLKASWSFQDITEKGFRIGTATAYAKFHQYGTGIYGPNRHPIVPKRTGLVKGRDGKMHRPALAFVSGGMLFIRASVKGAPKRRMVPDRGLPKAWRASMKAAAEETIAALLGG